MAGISTRIQQAAAEKNTEVNEEIEVEGYTQNLSKQVLSTRVVGAGSVAEMKELLRLPATGQAAAVMHRGHLGPMIHLENKKYVERAKRVQGSVQGFEVDFECKH